MRQWIHVEKLQKSDRQESESSTEGNVTSTSQYCLHGASTSLKELTETIWLWINEASQLLVGHGLRFYDHCPYQYSDGQLEAATPRVGYLVGGSPKTQLLLYRTTLETLASFLALLVKNIDSYISGSEVAVHVIRILNLFAALLVHPVLPKSKLNLLPPDDNTKF